MGMRRLKMAIGMFAYQDLLLLCFVLGVLGGTGAALAFGGEVVQGGILGMAGMQAAPRQRAAAEFLGVWRGRALETGVGWLAGLTVCSRMLFGFLTFYCGMSLAVVMSVLTMQKGILGIAGFFLAVLPQGLIYLLIWYVLSVWSGQSVKKLHILPGILLIAIAGGGAFLEVYISPFLSGLL